MSENEIEFAGRRLPHWRVEGATYFVTWRLHETQPRLKPNERDVVFRALHHFDGSRYDMFACVVMDDHVHALFTPKQGHALPKILHSWKSFTAHTLQRSSDRVGRVWQRESYDRVVRSEADLLEKARYILDNPQKRWPELTAYEWVRSVWTD